MYGLFLKMAFLASFSFIFSLFQTNITILKQVNAKNIHPVCGAGFQTHDFWMLSLIQ